MPKLRIISGSSKGRRLRSVPGDTTRPITDRVKTSLFDILGHDITASTFLDLFAGTGSVGIEALSRGAEFVLFIDNNFQAIQTVKYNLKISGLEDSAEVVKTDAFSYLRHPEDRAFDFIYVAPPQYKSLWLKALQELDKKPGWLGVNGWIIVQIHPVEYQKMELLNFSEFDRRDYGSTILIFYSRD